MASRSCAALTFAGVVSNGSTVGFCRLDLASEACVEGADSGPFSSPSATASTGAATDFESKVSGDSNGEVSHPDGEFRASRRKPLSAVSVSLLFLNLRMKGSCQWWNVKADSGESTVRSFRWCSWCCLIVYILELFVLIGFNCLWWYYNYLINKYSTKFVTK